MLIKFKYQYLVILSSFYLAVGAQMINFAHAKPVIHCLGREETQFHRNQLSGPLYTLNQMLVNELTGLGDFDFVSPYKEMVCDKNDYPPSVAFLKIILEVGELAIDIKFRHDASEGERAYKKAIIKKLVEDAPHYFFSYLSALQSQAPTPNCLEQEIPNLKKLRDKYFYLEEDLPSEELMNGKKEIIQIFHKIKNIKTIFNKCQASKAKIKAK